MYYTVYQITNQINKKIYIGVHKTNNLEDGYMGSGKHLIAAQNKYGIENFKKEYIQIFNNPKEMFRLESQLVTIEFTKRKDTYNLKEGGFGGFESINISGKNIHSNSEEHRSNISNGLKRYWDKIPQESDVREKLRKAMSIINSKRTSYLKPFLGRKHSEETLIKMRNIHRKISTGIQNSRYGRVMVTDIITGTNYTVLREELEKELLKENVRKGIYSNYLKLLQKPHSQKIEKKLCLLEKRIKNSIKQKESFIFVHIYRTNSFSSINKLYKYLVSKKYFLLTEECLRLKIKSFKAL